MKKLTEIFEPQKPQVLRDLKRIDHLIHGDQFLKGIGLFSKELNKPQNFPLVDNYLKAAEMLVSESIYDMPEPWSYQCFMEVWEEEDGRIMFNSTISSDELIKIDNYIEAKKNSLEDDFSAELFKLIRSVYKKHHIQDFLLSTNALHEDVEDWIAEDPDYVINDIFPNEIEGLIGGLIQTSFYIGLDNSDFYTRIMEAFETGGLPAGWVGPTPENGGGKPENCLLLLHYGR